MSIDTNEIPSTCTHDDRRKVGRGLCAACYTTDWHRRHPDAASIYQARWRAKGIPCPVDGCDRLRSINRRYCEIHYRRRREGLAPDGLVPKRCETCDAPFRGKRATRYCGIACRDAAHRLRKRAVGYRPPPISPEANRIHNHKRRARRRAVAIEDFTEADICSRDGWICGICRERVHPPRFARDPEGPSIDHIVPLSKGGPHTRANVRLTHLRCNVKRGDRAA